jgi:concanavalin A-like lectin/glucanase superfamily protein
MSGIRFAAMALVLASGCAFDLAEVAERRRVPITVVTDVTATLTDVPVLVRLDPSRIDYALTKADGADLRFTDASGAELAHEIASWDPAGTSIVWVRLAELAPGTVFYLEHGGLEHSVDPVPLWSSYTGAWHFDDTLADGTVRDSGGSGVVGFGEHMTSADAVAGHTAGGFFFDGTQGEGPRVAFNSDLRFEVPPGESRSIELWFKPEPGATTTMSLAEKEGCCLGWAMTFGQAEVGYRFGVGCCVFNCCGGDTDDYSYASQPLPGGPADTDWHYAVQTVDRVAGSIHGYLDGRDGVPGTLTAADTVGTQIFHVGGGYDPMMTTSFHGVIDEVRIAPVAVTPEWVEVQYASMSDTLLVYGPPEGAP